MTVFKTVAFNHSATSPAAGRIAADPSTAGSRGPRYARRAVNRHPLPRLAATLLATAVLLTSSLGTVSAAPPVDPELAPKLESLLVSLMACGPPR